MHIESAGKYQRWKLIIYGGKEDEKLIRLLERSKEIYQDDRKALISVALVLWRDRSVTEIRDYVDGEFGRQFAEVLTSDKGPIFYYSKQEKIFLRRWAEVLLGEGKDSKALSAAEEEQLQSLAYELRTKHHLGVITPEVLRELAGMGNTKSEQTLSSTILSKWAQKGVVRKIGKGNYEFIKKVRTDDPFADLLDKFEIPAQTPNA